MNPSDLAQLCANSLNAAKRLGLPLKEAHVLVTTPKGWKAPPRFPRGKIVNHTSDGGRVRYLPAMNLLAWMVASGMVKPTYEDRDDFAVDPTA
ncbi:hypothetical protein FXV83_15910 [Bradyrhizobium hipponense]|uniref:Uncharacterized protein n=1 Tax=Bradyrhizobium hipponense TaxID=2605638 RepID=A0A5S4YM27_9BRAD|nr:hypothetical protein [Bradyrhizobium hipponense]TYO65420.1 hypothetical protein FXV83_15910 [Bradyrhizobium hipponense]